MVSIVGIPKDMGAYFEKQVSEEEYRTAKAIETQAKLTAPIDTGNFQDRIQAVKNVIMANAIYSAWLEYGTMNRNGKTITFSPPHATMRRAAITVARMKGYRFE